MATAVLYRAEKEELDCIDETILLMIDDAYQATPSNIMNREPEFLCDDFKNQLSDRGVLPDETGPSGNDYLRFLVDGPALSAPATLLASSIFKPPFFFFLGCKRCWLPFFLLILKFLSCLLRK
jgi:hypothetical protein